MQEPYLYTQHMTVGYGNQPLIRDICLQLRRGQIMTLIGPNGSGKSTILKSIIKQLRLLGGAVYLDGRAMAQMNELDIAKRLSVLMTERIHPELMTCEDVVSTGRYPYTGRLGILTAQDRQKVQEALALVHGQDIAHCHFFCCQRRSAAAHSAGPGALSGAGGAGVGRAHLFFWISGTNWSFYPF